MKENEKAAPDAANIKSGRKRGEFQTTNISKANITTSPPRMQDGIAAYIPAGAENALTAQQLADMSGLSLREVRRGIQLARLKGAPICASCAEPFGCYFTDDVLKLAHYVVSLHRRMREIAKTCEAMETTLDTMTGQMRIEEVECGDY